MNRIMDIKPAPVTTWEDWQAWKNQQQALYISWFGKKINVEVK